MATLLYAASSFHGASRLAHVAATNALPSTRELTAARTELRRLNAAMDFVLLRKMEGQPFDPALVDEPRRSLEAHLSAYRSLPSYPEEEALFQKIMQDLAALDGAQAKAVQLIRSGELGAAHRFENQDWRIATDRLDDAIDVLVVFNSRNLGENVWQLERSSTRSLLLVSLFGLLNLLLAASAVRVFIQGVREHEKNLRDRAHEWEMFSGRVAHDLMSPLQGVSVALSIAGDRSLDREVVKIARRGQAALARLRGTVDTLLDFARSGGQPLPGERTRVPEVVTPLLDELRSLAESNQVELSADPLPALEVACSDGVLYILLSNLLRNAIKYIGNKAVRSVALTVSVTDERARFEVKDSGPGLEPGMEQRIFEPFVRGRATDVAGIGLGLATVKRMAEAYGGAVGVRSVAGEGCVFWVELPKYVP